MPHRFLLDINPNSFALLVVIGMATTGLLLGTVMDRLISWIGIAVNAKSDLK